MNVINTINLCLAIIAECMMVYGVYRGYASWKLVLFPGIQMAHIIAFYVSIAIFQPGMTQFFTTWSAVLRFHELLTIIVTMLVYWHERFRNSR